MAAKYDQIGIDYNLSRKADPYLTERLRHHLSPNPKGNYLDIGCGTGNYTDALFQKGIKMIGVDPSTRMLEQARKRNENIQWLLGNAEQIPLTELSVQGAVATLTLHHWDDLEKGFLELHRVIKTKGKLVIFTALPEQTNNYWLAHYFPKMIKKSSAKLPFLTNIETALSKCSFRISYKENYSVHENLQDLFLYSGKFNPELYFNTQVRNGISSFSDLANQSEVEKGLKHLRIDINSGEINQIVKSYEHEMGDYIYIIAEKNS